jgi:hypothetical protein
MRGKKGEVLSSLNRKNCKGVDAIYDFITNANAAF